MRTNCTREKKIVSRLVGEVEKFKCKGRKNGVNILSGLKFDL